MPFARMSSLRFRRMAGSGTHDDDDDDDDGGGGGGGGGGTRQRVASTASLLQNVDVIVASLVGSGSIQSLLPVLLFTAGIYARNASNCFSDISMVLLAVLASQPFAKLLQPLTCHMSSEPVTYPVRADSFGVGAGHEPLQRIMDDYGIKFHTIIMDEASQVNTTLSSRSTILDGRRSAHNFRQQLRALSIAWAYFACISLLAFGSLAADRHVVRDGWYWARGIVVLGTWYCGTGHAVWGMRCSVRRQRARRGMRCPALR
eukprot:858217-Rhodomonas_salina.2